jgi:FtsP/CotA-like multicopper oxidase with cupredoxin domain
MATLSYDSKKVRRDNPQDSSIALAANPLPSRLELDSAEKSALLMQGGAMGSLRSARYKGQELTMRELVQQGMVWAFNGEAGLPEAPLLRAKRGQTVVLDIVNDNRWPHAMHLHGHHFRVLARDGQAVNEPDWRDTLLMSGGEQIQIGFVADNPGKWVLHCHMLEHQAAGMVTWLEVV